MSLTGVETGGKHGGVHQTTHENTSPDENIENSRILDRDFLQKTINETVAVSSICLENGGAENSEETMVLLSPSEELDGYDRAVIENNTEWLKSRCRSLEGVDFGMTTSGNDLLDLGVKDEKGIELFEEMETISPEEGEEVDDTTVISICNDTGVLTATSLNVSPNTDIIHIAPPAGSNDSDRLAEQLGGLENILQSTTDKNQKTILLSPEQIESLQRQGFVLDTSVLNSEGAITPIKNNPETVSSNSANSSSVILETTPSGNIVQSLDNVEQNRTELELTKKINILNPSQTIIPSSTGTYVVAQPTPGQPETENPSQPNLTLATISISTDKVANSTQILVNTNQGQQLYLINTADLTQATNALQPLAQPQEATPPVVTSPVAPTVVTPTQPSPVMSAVSPLQVQGTGYLLLPINSENNGGQGMILSVPPSSDGSPSKKIWICQEEGCNKVFRKLSKLKVHQMRHTGERPHKCLSPGCDWAFTTAYKLKRHAEAHGGRKDFHCTFEGCGRKFTTIYNLNSHKKLHDRPFTEICPKQSCRQQFTNKRQLDLHMRSHAGIEKNYKCPHEGCDKVFFSRNCMGSHARVHLIEKEDLQCKFEGCGKVFDKMCRLKQHTRQHTGEKPYVCTYEGCTWAFATASKLKRHSAKHTGLRRWTCNICLKGFMRSEHLKGHMITHFGDKPFNCPVGNCMAKFSAKGSLNVHLKKHESTDKKITYHCPIDGCLSHYSNKSNLRNHILKHYLNISPGSEGSNLDLVPLLTGDEISDTAIDNLITSSTETPTPSTINVSIPQLLTDTATNNNNNNNNSLINTAEFINTGSVNETVMLTTDSAAINSIIPVQQGNTGTAVSLLTGKTVHTSKPTSTNSNTVSPDLPTVISRVALENTSGSARTDYRSNHILSDRARKRWHSLRALNTDCDDLENLRKESNEKLSSLVLPAFNTDFTSTDISNTQGLMFRDPETGITYVQTQLLQDDPPHPEIYPEDLIDSSDEVLNNLPSTPTSGCNKSDFTGTTINLQDLE